jgi:hypothetical protein
MQILTSCLNKFRVRLTGIVKLAAKAERVSGQIYLGLFRRCLLLWWHCILSNVLFKIDAIKMLVFFWLIKSITGKTKKNRGKLATPKIAKSYLTDFS